MREEKPSAGPARSIHAPPACPPDEVLAVQARGDPEAFGLLYQRHVQSVYRYHLAHTGDTQDAQDLTAQTFLAALEGIGGYRGQCAFLGWLLGIASHKMADHYRRGRAVLPLEKAEELPLDAPPLEETTAVRLQVARVQEALKTIAPERAEALILRVFAGLSAAETGQMMGKSEAAVRMLVHRGLGDLRQALPLQWDREP